MIVYPTDFEYVEIPAMTAPLLPIPCFYWFRPLKDSYTTSEGFGQFRTPHNRHDESRSTFPHTYANLLNPDISRVGHRGTGRRRENVIGMVQCYKQLKVPLSRDGKDKEEYSAGTWKAYNNVEVQVRYQLQEGMPTKPRKESNEFGRSTSVMADIPEVLGFLERCKGRGTGSRPNDRAAWSEARPDPPSKLVVQEPRKRLRTRGIKTVNAQRNFWIQRKAQMSWSQWRNPAGIPSHKNNVNGGRSGSPKPLAPKGRGRLSREAENTPPILYGAGAVQMAGEARGLKLPPHDENTPSSRRRVNNPPRLGRAEQAQAVAEREGSKPLARTRGEHVEPECQTKLHGAEASRTGQNGGGSGGTKPAGRGGAGAAQIASGGGARKPCARDDDRAYGQGFRLIRGGQMYQIDSYHPARAAAGQGGRNSGGWKWLKRKDRAGQKPRPHEKQPDTRSRDTDVEL
ncbi:hypothetical protein C8R44DRAFT_750577 [Mycena epipterygia]|nr:hypothetical protein C8R44DRAFT_750577 [Mycena epipterygia]